MKDHTPVLQISIIALSLGFLASATANPNTASSSPVASATPSGNEALTPKSLTKGSALKIKACFTTSGTWEYGNGPVAAKDVYTENNYYEESLTFTSSSSYRDPDDDEFSVIYKRIDNFTAEATFTQTKAGGGDTLANEKGQGKFTLLFTSYDKATNTLHGTIVWTDRYKGTGWYAAESVPGKYADKTTGTGIFTLKLK
jgi:hypothetical protein